MEMKNGVYKNRTGITVNVTRIYEDRSQYPTRVEMMVNGELITYSATINGCYIYGPVESPRDIVEYLNPETHPHLYL